MLACHFNVKDSQNFGFKILVKLCLEFSENFGKRRRFLRLGGFCGQRLPGVGGLRGGGGFHRINL